MNIQHRNRLLSARKVLNQAQKGYESTIKGVIADGVSQKEIAGLLKINESTLSRRFGKRRTKKGSAS